tara:strand:+ start:99 stop:1343 length:1245 start_codon:yes stop_codon:yes gene_type:complete
MSIFSKPPPPPVEKINETRFADVELSISKRYSALDSKINNLFDGLGNRLSKFDEQVNILLKRTYELESKVEGQLIDVENTAKKQLHKQLDRMDQFEKIISKSYITTVQHKDISNDIAGTIRGVKTEMDSVSSEVKRVEKSIPRDTVSLSSVSKLKSELDIKVEKIANAIPKNTVTGDTLTNVRQELIDLIQNYATTDALKALSNTATQLTSKNNDANKTISDTFKVYQRDLGIQKEQIKTIQNDYLNSSFIKTVDSKLSSITKDFYSVVQDTNSKIPKNTISESEFNTLLEKQKQLNKVVSKNHKSSFESLDVVDKSITSKVNKSISGVSNEVEQLKQTIIELKLGSDTSGLKLMVRELVDDVVRDIKNINDFALGNFKTLDTERKKEIQDVSKRLNEVQSGFSRLVNLTKGNR